MSGSGSAVYGYFPKVDPEALAQLLRDQMAACDIHVCQK